MIKTKYYIFLIFFFISSISLYGQQFYSIQGKISDNNTLELLTGTAIYIIETKQGTVADNNGTYSFYLPEGKYTITASLIGYYSDTLFIVLKNDVKLDFNLIEKSYDIESVIFKGEQNKNIANSEIGTVQLSGKDFKNIPTIFGEKDPVKILQLTPGVQAAKEGFSGIYIRGGGPDQNLFLLDDAVAYNPSHLLGFFSVFNSDIVDNLKLVKAGMPAEYGGRLASVIEVNTIDGNYDKLHGNIGIGLISSKATIEGPIVKQKASFYLSARRTYIDLLLKPFEKKLEESSNFFSTSKYYFYDINAKISLRLNSKNQLTLTGYSGNDTYDFKRDIYNFTSNIDWGNNLANLKWNHVFNENFYMKNSLGFSQYRFNFFANQNKYSFSVNSHIKNDFYFKNKFTLLKNKHLFIFGGEYIKYNVRPTKQYAQLNETLVDFSDENIYYGNEAALYFSDNFDIKKLKIDVGLRFSYFEQIGPYRKYFYDFLGNISDSIIIAKGETNKNYIRLEPRVSFRYLIDDLSSIKLAYTQNYQYIHISPISTVSLPTDIWVLCTDKIKPQLGIQISTGYYRNLFQNKYELSGELYFKHFSNQIEFIQNVFTNLQSTIDERLFFGKGKSYGMEIFFKKTQGIYTGWVGYTLSRSLRKFDNINNGDWFFAKYDRTHDLSFVNNYKLSNSLSLSAVFVYATGNAFTMPVARYLIQGKIINYYSGLNTFRMPTYHRLDVSLNYTKQKRNRTITWDFSVYNLYNRKNPYYIYFEVIGSAEEKSLKVEPRIVSLFPVLPSISWNMKF